VSATEYKIEPGVGVGVGIGVKLAVTVKLPLRATVVVSELELPTAPVHPEKLHPELGEAAMLTTVPQ
jgi:H+/Cl- antiporter ClcA